MGEWRKDQSKKTRRYIWGQTRGQSDGTWQDFAIRIKEYPILGGLKFEKIGDEVHCWREVLEDTGETYWMSCLRFTEDGYGHWSVFYRTDESRWRATDIKKIPIGRALAGAAEWYRDRMQQHHS